ncbi:cysteine desulfurase family protein [Parerythrobacter lacustris]|uniref:Cysteine desulfurase n=1 Tax=Parerythrobacter lacustris TaxID=2969984 RepID=A0ABT1XUQ0_9SPHN|nr:aminotransferase class V-fold PLP-dependent enzyme [Parerythrobacter lacustris]
MYLDHAATSPLRPEARAAMEEGFRIWANPSSPHAEGRKAKAALEDARERVKRALGWEGEVIFTSGASEAAALALRNAVGGKRIVTEVEHDCVLQAATGADHVPVLPDGQVDLHELASALKCDRPVVAIQDVNSETGNRQVISFIQDMVAEAGGMLIVDCAQSAGKMNIDSPEMAIISAHKFGGPIGVGALLVKDFALLKPEGGHERGYRRGTENLPAILGMAAAIELSESFADEDTLRAFHSMDQVVREAGGDWLSDRLSSDTAFISAISMPSIGASAQVMRFDMEGISVSQGSACSSGTMKVSRVLRAMQVEPEIAANTIRVSVGWSTTPDDIERFCETWLAMAKSSV